MKAKIFFAIQLQFLWKGTSGYLLTVGIEKTKL